MDIRKLKARYDGGKHVVFEIPALRGMVVDHLYATMRAGEHTISFDSLMPDIFVDKLTGDEVDVTVGEALDAIIKN